MEVGISGTVTLYMYRLKYFVINFTGKLTSDCSSRPLWLGKTQKFRPAIPSFWRIESAWPRSCGIICNATLNSDGTQSQSLTFVNSDLSPKRKATHCLNRRASEFFQCSTVMRHRVRPVIYGLEFNIMFVAYKIGDLTAQQRRLKRPGVAFWVYMTPLLSWQTPEKHLFHHLHQLLFKSLHNMPVHGHRQIRYGWWNCFAHISDNFDFETSQYYRLHLKGAKMAKVTYYPGISDNFKTLLQKN